MWNTRLAEAQAGIKTAGRNINNFRYADDTTLMAEGEEELKSLSMEVKEESEKVGLKLNIQKMKIMTSSCIVSWQIEGGEGGEKEKVTDFMFLASKVTADSVSWQKSYDKSRQCIRKQRYHFADYRSYSQSYDISISYVQIWELDHKEDWVPKNWCLWTIVLEMTLERPLGNKEIKPVYPKWN